MTGSASSSDGLGPSGYRGVSERARRQSHDLLRLHFYDGDTLCTKICADKVTRCLAVENLVDDSLSTAFGVNTSPTWEDLEEFSGGAMRSPPAGRACSTT